MLQAVHSVLFFVRDVQEAAQWYADLLQDVPEYPDPNFALFRVGGVELCFHPADAKMCSGAAGQVAYWRVADLGVALATVQARGATLYRGPLDIEDGLTICQIKDPFGNLLGLVGPYCAGASS
jgi:predicted enzyme related to lactoylglutathione lyase